MQLDPLFLCSLLNKKKKFITSSNLVIEKFFSSIKFCWFKAIYESIFNVTVFVQEIKENQMQILDEAFSVLLSTNALEKGINQFSLL